MAQKTPKEEEGAEETTLTQMVREAEEPQVTIVRRDELKAPPGYDDLIKIQVISGLAYLCQIDILTASLMVDGMIHDPG